MFVGRKFQELINNYIAKIDLSLYALFFHNYGHVARFVGYLNPDGSYTSHWKPLEKADYYQYFVSPQYSDDHERALKILEEL